MELVSIEGMVESDQSPGWGGGGGFPLGTDSGCGIISAAVKLRRGLLLLRVGFVDHCC